MSLFVRTIREVGRPTKTPAERRSTTFQLRFTPGEMAQLRQAARKGGGTIADLLREAVAPYLVREGKGEPKGKEKRNGST